MTKSKPASPVILIKNQYGHPAHGSPVWVGGITTGVPGLTGFKVVEVVIFAETTKHSWLLALPTLVPL